MGLNGAGTVGSDIAVKVLLQGCWEFWCLNLKQLGAERGFGPLFAEGLAQGSLLSEKLLTAIKNLPFPAASLKTTVTSEQRTERSSTQS